MTPDPNTDTNIDIGQAFERLYAEPEDDLPVRTRDEPSCLHKQSTLNTTARVVVCKACGEQLDPFEVLLRATRDVERWVRLRDECIRRAKEAHDRLQEVLRLERNARARLKRLGEAPPDRPWGADSPPL